MAHPELPDGAGKEMTPHPPSLFSPHAFLEGASPTHLAIGVGARLLVLTAVCGEDNVQRITV